MFEFVTFSVVVLLGVSVGMHLSIEAVNERRKAFVIAGVCIAGQELIKSAKRMPDPFQQACVASDAKFLLHFANHLENLD